VEDDDDIGFDDYSYWEWDEYDDEPEDDEPNYIEVVVNKKKYTEIEGFGQF